MHHNELLIQADVLGMASEERSGRMAQTAGSVNVAFAPTSKGLLRATSAIAR